MWPGCCWARRIAPGASSGGGRRCATTPRRRKKPRGGTASPTEGTPVGTKDDDPDPDLVAWQEYLRTMEAEEARLTEDPGAN